jgi:hypothetical protein
MWLGLHIFQHETELEHWQRGLVVLAIVGAPAAAFVAELRQYFLHDDRTRDYPKDNLQEDSAKIMAWRVGLELFICALAIGVVVVGFPIHTQLITVAVILLIVAFRMMPLVWTSPIMWNSERISGPAEFGLLGRPSKSEIPWVEICGVDRPIGSRWVTSKSGLRIVWTDFHDCKAIDSAIRIHATTKADVSKG